MKNSLILDRTLVRFLLSTIRKKMNIEIIPVTAFQQNCSLIWDDEKMQRLSILVAMQKNLFNVLRN